MEANSGLYANAYFLDSATPFTGRIHRKPFGKHKRIPARELHNANLHRNDLNKISFRLDYMEAYEAAIRDFPQFAVGLWGDTGHRVEFADFGQKGVHKAKAVDILSEYVDASFEDTIAFVDVNDDSTMPQDYAIGVAMETLKLR